MSHRSHFSAEPFPFRHTGLGRVPTVVVIVLAALGWLAGARPVQAQLARPTARIGLKSSVRGGNVAVADSGNHRVLIYSSPLRTDESASLVLGQPDFVQNSPNQGNSVPAANTLAAPAGVAQGPNGELYVADTRNCRVLRFDPPFTSGMNASLVLGEPDFVTRNCFTLTAADANSLAAPFAVAVDSQGDLWVVDTFFGDTGDSRVLEYVPPFTDGMAASVVIGQTTTGASQGCNQVFATPPHFPPATASTLCAPKGLTFDTAGHLWIADMGNNRVLQFVPPFTTGMSASLELGQPAGAEAFITNTPNQCLFSIPGCGPDAGKLFYPIAIVFDSRGDLWVTDAGNNRVLEYRPSFSDGMDASLVLGQPDFTSGATGTITGYLALPQGLAYQPSTGNLLVSDSSLNRVLVFQPPFRTNMQPRRVIGQATLSGTQPNQGDTAASPNTVDFPIGVAVLR
jgi:sugar lactone lactonase YvrE